MQGKAKLGVISRGIKTPIIKFGDDVVKVVVDSVINTVGVEGIQDKDAIGTTESIVAISQGNIVTQKDIIKDLSNKFAGVKTLGVVDPIQSRNRFMAILKAISAMPELETIYLFMTYPTDEVGNRLVSDEVIMGSGVNPYSDVLTQQEFYDKLGKPAHPFTGKDYMEMYREILGEKAKIIMCNDFSKIPNFCKDILVCSIHRRAITKRILETNGATHVLDLSEIMNAPVDGSGYNANYGLYGSNIQSNDDLKLLPRDCEKFVKDVQEEMFKRTGKKVEAYIFGDGAFKDPVGGIWELADPTTTPAATEGLKGTPEEVKLKYIASAHKDKTPEEIEAIVAAEKAARKEAKNISETSSLGTTPRQITDLISSLSDLTTGSGDRQTPVVLVQNYL